jgi:low affinity Fe/Cu permease
VLSIVVWALLGPLMGFSDGWQLTINTGTTIVTFLMVFLIQNTQNRDAAAVQIKLDELIRVTEQAHNTLLNLEELSPEELEKFRQRYVRLARMERRGVPKIDPSVQEVAADRATG